LTEDGGPPARGATGDQLRAFQADLLEALAHPARVKVLDLLRGGPRAVSELQAELGIEPWSVSQQLAHVRAKHVVEGRREATSVYRTVRDPHVFVLLDAARQIASNYLVDLQEPVADEEVALAAAAE
jgi:ArsR family transcriptional regulator